MFYTISAAVNVRCEFCAIH